MQPNGRFQNSREIQGGKQEMAVIGYCQKFYSNYDNFGEFVFPYPSFTLNWHNNHLNFYYYDFNPLESFLFYHLGFQNFTF